MVVVIVVQEVLGVRTADGVDEKWKKLLEFGPHTLQHVNIFNKAAYEYPLSESMSLSLQNSGTILTFSWLLFLC